MKPKSNYITPQQFDEIIRWIPNLQSRKWSTRDIQMSMKIAYYCCLRYGAEVSYLTKEDFDFEKMEVYLGKTKTRQEDYAPIANVNGFPLELRTYLAGKQPLEPILKDCDAQNMYKWLLKIGDVLQVQAFLTPQSITGEKTKLHIFRKSMLKDIMYGTFGKRGHIGHAQSMARHKKATTTAAYLHLDIEASKEFFDDLTTDRIV